MDRFCGNCGAPMGSNGVCPVCGAAAEAEDAGKQPAPKQKKARTAAKKNGKKKHTGLLVAGIAAGVLVLTFGILTLLQALGAVDIPLFRKMLGQEESREIPAEYLAEAPDAESYYRERGEIRGRADASKSAAMTEAEAVRFFRARGFDQQPVTYEYAMDGTYRDPAAADEGGSQKHPMYETAYTSTYGIVWNLYLINGRIIAEPVSFNAQRYYDPILMLSETDTLTSYDAASGAYYETVPDRSVCRVRTLDRIDADALDQLSEGGLEE